MTTAVQYLNNANKYANETVTANTSPFSNTLKTGVIENM